MTPQNFKDNWTSIDETLSPLTRARLERFSLLKSTVDFLAIAGLPVFAEPNLYFAHNTDDKVYGINKLTEQYELYDKKADYEKYIVIGSCRDGDAIAINTHKNDQIEELDHEDSFSSKFFNSSINSLAAFLIFYRDFEKSVLADKDQDDNFQCFNFTDNQFYYLKAKMLSIDSKSLTEGFWKDELEIMLFSRKEYFGIQLQ